MKLTGIVLGLQKHTDKASFLHVITRETGRQCILVFGKKWCSILLPMAIVDLEVSDRKPSYRVLKEASLHYVADGNNIAKSCIRLFLAEVLGQTITHPMEDQPLFDFVYKMTILLDQAEEPQNVHLIFLLGLADCLGLGIDYEMPQYRLYKSVLEGEKIARADRQAMLKGLCAHFEEHIEDFQKPKSLDILATIFD